MNDEQKMLILENKSRVLLLNLIDDPYWRQYEFAVKIYLYFKGKLDRVDSHLETSKFYSALYREIPYAKVLLLSDHPYYSSSAEAYKNITKLDRWKAIYHALNLNQKLPLLYEEFETTKPVQLSLFMA